MKILEKFNLVIVLLCALLLAAGMIAQPQICIDGARNAVQLCMNTVIPSLFPFFVCSGLFVALGLAYLAGRTLSPLMRPFFNVPGSGAIAFVLGIISGYPVGAKCAADLYTAGECSKTEAERLLAFCNNSGPLFIIGAVGVGMLKNPHIGRLLYISHFISALLTGIVFRFYGGKASGSCALPPSKVSSVRSAFSAVGEVIANSVDTMLKVCAFVIVFAVFGALLPQMPCRSFIYGLLEITGGIRAWTDGGGGGHLFLPCISFFLAFSGISVLLQVGSIISDAGLSAAPYITGKLIQGGISFAVTAMLMQIFPQERAAFAPQYIVIPNEVIMTPKGAFLLSLLMIGISLVSILILCAIMKMIEKK